VTPGKFAVDFRIGIDPLLGASADLPRDPCRGTDGEHAVRHGHSRRYDRAGRDKRAPADDCAVQDCRAVADQRLGGENRAVDHAQMADGHALADLGNRVLAAMQHRAVLDVRSAPDDDRTEVRAQYRSVPDRCFVLDADVTDERSCRGDPG
jgi:hypothetical protein